MSLFRDDGIVLRTQKLGEADRIITLLTRGHGRVRAVAEWRAADQVEVRGAARTLLARGRAVLGAGERAHRARPAAVHASETIAPYGGGGIVTDYARYTAGTAMLETAERVRTDHEGEPAVQQDLLLSSAGCAPWPG